MGSILNLFLNSVCFSPKTMFLFLVPVFSRLVQHEPNLVGCLQRPSSPPLGYSVKNGNKMSFMYHNKKESEHRYKCEFGQWQVVGRTPVHFEDENYDPRATYQLHMCIEKREKNSKDHGVCVYSMDHRHAPAPRECKSTTKFARCVLEDNLRCARSLKGPLGEELTCDGVWQAGMSLDGDTISAVFMCENEGNYECVSTPIDTQRKTDTHPV